MNTDLMRSVSGIRGIFGESINPEIVMKYASQFGLFQKKTKKNITIVVGRDSRTTGEALINAAISGLLSVGVDVINLGIVATPTLLLNVLELKAQGGICITASHNPEQWNAMKFVDGNGMFLFPEKMTEFLNAVDKEEVKYAAYNKIGKLNVDFDASYRHIQKILNIPYLDIERIRKKKYKVVLDSVNGAGGVITPTLLYELGCKVISINEQPTGLFAHTPEPLNKNLKQICDKVKIHKADIGFATDPDVDRLAIINENGECIGEEFSLLLAEKFILSNKRGDIVTNLSSSMASDVIAKEFNVKLHRTKVGEINVGKKMRELKSPVGGEGNGGIICPDVNYTRDAISGIALILGYMANKNKTIKQLASEIPKFHFAKDKIVEALPILNKIMKKAESIKTSLRFLPDKEIVIDKTDGIKIILDNAWIHIRKSGTEPIIRVYVEAETIKEAKRLCADMIKELKS